MNKPNRLPTSRKHRDPKKESFWRDCVKRQSRSGLGVRAFCSRELLKETAFYFWRREIQHRDGQVDAKRPVPATFVELVSEPAAVSAPPATGADLAAIELLLPLDRRVLIRRGFDVSLLHQVLAALAPASLPAASLSSPSNPSALGVAKGEGRSC